MANPEDLGRYRLKRLLGRGALGEVWEAADREEPALKVAVKIMHAADEELALARSQFAREARLAVLMQHPHFVTVHDAGEAAGTSFLVMDMVEGTSLRAMLRSSAPPTTTEKLTWLRQVGDALAAMHRVGLVHRDLKPENVIVRPDRTACLVDLGIAKWIKFDLGGELDSDRAIAIPAGHSVPISSYTPPETIVSEQYDELGDQYAFGIVAYELLTGAIPGDAAPPLADRAELPPAVGAALDRARSFQRDARWDAIELLVDQLGSERAPASAPPPSRKPTSRGPSSVGEARASVPRPPAPPPPAVGTDASKNVLSPRLIGAVVVVIAVVVLALVVLR